MAMDGGREPSNATESGNGTARSDDQHRTRELSSTTPLTMGKRARPEDDESNGTHQSSSPKRSRPTDGKGHPAQPHPQPGRSPAGMEAGQAVATSSGVLAPSGDGPSPPSGQQPGLLPTQQQPTSLPSAASEASHGPGPAAPTSLPSQQGGGGGGGGAATTAAAEAAKKKRYARGSIEDLTSEVLRVLQASGPLPLPDIVKALPRFIREQAQGLMEKVMDVLRVTPLVNLVRQADAGPSDPPLYAFLDGRRVAKPIDIPSTGAHMRELDHQERVVQRRIAALKTEVAKLEGGATARPEDAAAMLERVLAEGSRGSATSSNHSGRQNHANGGAEAAGPLYSAAMHLARQEAERARREQQGGEQAPVVSTGGVPVQQLQQPPPRPAGAIP